MCCFGCVCLQLYLLAKRENNCSYFHENFTVDRQRFWMMSLNVEAKVSNVKIAGSNKPQRTDITQRMSINWSDYVVFSTARQLCSLSFEYSLLTAFNLTACKVVLHQRIIFKRTLSTRIIRLLRSRILARCLAAEASAVLLQHRHVLLLFFREPTTSRN